MTQRTFVIIKPDAVSRGLAGLVISRYEAKGLAIAAIDLRRIDADFAALHYAEHIGRDYFAELIAFMTSGPLIPMVVDGEGAVAAVRSLNGATNGLAAAPGTIRGDYALSTRQNIVHAADSELSAAGEIALWFPDL